MGEASMQVVYVDPAGQKGDIIFVDTAQYKVYSRSYLGLGADYARYQFSDNPNCFPKEFPMADGKGNGDYHASMNDIKKLIGKESDANCIRSLEKIPYGTSFCAISTFWNIATSPQFGWPTKNPPPITINSLTNKGSELAATKDWAQMVNTWPNDSYLFSSLFTSAYMIEVLEQLGFSPDEEVAILDTGWTVGASIYLTYNIELESKKLANLKATPVNLLARDLKESNLMAMHLYSSNE